MTKANGKAIEYKIVQEFLENINFSIATLCRKIPHAVEVLEEVAERDPNDYADAVIRLVKAKRQMEEEAGF